MKTGLIALLAVFCAGGALAEGSGHSHSGHAMPEAEAQAGMAALGGPAKAVGIGRDVTVTMRETEDGAMIFEPAQLEVTAGETVRLIITNAGAQEHEFVMGSAAEVAEHKAMMEAMPDMVHAAPNALRLAPGARGEINWTFGAAGRFEFACLVPGHYDAGMHGPLIVR